MPSRGERTDRDLLQAYAESKDTDSLGAFFGRYQGTLLRFVGKMLGDADMAQDVVQETFLTVAREPRRLLDVDSCQNWLLRVARNIGISHLRKKTRARRHVEKAAPLVTEATAERERRRAEGLEGEEMRALVRAEVGKLSPRHREVLLLKVEEAKSYREIADITGLTVTNVGYLLHMAMKALSKSLKHVKEDLQ